MARIPITVAQRGLDTGSVVSYPSGSPIGSALENVGNSLQAAAERIRQKDEQKAAFDTDVLENEMLATLSGVERDAINGAPADASGLHDSVYGEMRPDGTVAKPGSFDATFDQFLARVPESRRQEFAAKREVYRLRGSNRLAQAQYNGEQAYYRTQIEKAQNALVNGIASVDPGDDQSYEEFVNQGLALIDKSGLPALEKDVARYNWQANASEALFKARLERDPSFAAQARAALGLATERTGRGTGSVIDRIIGVESGGRADAKNPNSSATGAGQFIASTWMMMIRRHAPELAEGRSRAQILALRNDPALSRRMTEALANDNAAALRAQGLPVNDGTIYLAHFAGAQGAITLLKAAPDASVQSILGADAVTANPFLRGKTASQVVAWAANKMDSAVPSSGPVDPRFQNIPFERRLVLANQADAAMADFRAQQRGNIESAVANAPVAIQNTGGYNQPMPTPEQFMQAYGSQDGAQRYNQFQMAVDTSRQVFEMKTMSADEIQALVKSAEPTSAGNTAALDQSRYNIISAAAQQTIAARNADPATYTRTVFPSVAKAWDGATNQEGMQAAIALTAAAQDQLGIRTPRYLPKDMAAAAIEVFKNADRREDDRIGAITGILFATNDPAQRRALFEQLVDAGLPEITEGAIEALSRGDEGAGRRLFQAALIDPSKLPGQAPFKPSEIDESIQLNLMDEGSIGDIYYGLTDGTVENFERAQRDQRLINNAVNIRVRSGEDLNTAVAAVSKDLYGDVQVVNERFAKILLPKDVDAETVTKNLSSLRPQVREALTKTLAIPADAPARDGTRAILGATAESYINNVMQEGYFRNAGDGFVFVDPYLGAAIAGEDGKPLTFSLEEVTATLLPLIRVRPDDAPLTDDDFDRFQKRMGW